MQSVRSLARVASSVPRVALSAPRSMPVRRMASGGDHDDHHSHQMFDTSTPWNPMGMPLAILVGVIGGGLGVIYGAISFTQSRFLKK